MSQFPLCEKAGLRCRTLGASLGLFISAAEVEAYLRETTQQNSVNTESVRRNEGTNYAEGAENKVTQSDNKAKENPVRDQEDAGELVFRASDFAHLTEGADSFLGAIAERATQIFRDWLSSQPVVYGRSDHRGWVGFCEYERNDATFGNDTHRARLVAVEPLVSDSADAIVRELAEYGENADGALLKIIERARALRAKGGG